MANLKQAPKLYHDKAKMDSNKCFYSAYPQELMDVIMNQIDGKSGNLLKIMWVLLGTDGSGRFSVSEAWMRDRTGMSQESYARARAKLVQMGWLSLEKGTICVNIDAIMGDSQSKTCDDVMPSEEIDMISHHALKAQHDIMSSEQTCHDIMSIQDKIDVMSSKTCREIMPQTCHDVMYNNKENIKLMRITAAQLEAVVGEIEYLPGGKVKLPNGNICVLDF